VYGTIYCHYFIIFKPIPLPAVNRRQTQFHCKIGQIGVINMSLFSKAIISIGQSDGFIISTTKIIQNASKIRDDIG